MKEPTSLRANIKFIWGLIYNSRMADATKAFNLLQEKMYTPLIDTNSASEADMQALTDLDQLLNQKPVTESTQDNVKLVQSLCSDSKLETESQDPPEFNG